MTRETFFDGQRTASLSICLFGVCQIFYLVKRMNKFDDELFERRSKTRDLSHDLSQDSFSKTQKAYSKVTSREN